MKKSIINHNKLSINDQINPKPIFPNDFKNNDEKPKNKTLLMFERLLNNKNKFSLGNLFNKNNSQIFLSEKEKYNNLRNNSIIKKNQFINFKKIIIAFFSVIYLYLINYYFNNHNHNNNNNKKKNNNNDLFYENNIDFSNYSTDIKSIAIYLPNFYSNNKFIYLKNTTSIDKLDYLPDYYYRNNINKYSLKLILNKQIELAQKHGIYGFAIYYYWFSGKTSFDIPLDLIYKNKRNFHYMLIWKNENATNENNNEILGENMEKKIQKILLKILKNI